MRNPYVKMLLFVLLVVFCIFFGVDIANRGMERIQGPVSAAGSPATTIKAAAASLQHAAEAPAIKPAAPVAGTGNAAAAKPPAVQPAHAEQDEALNYVGNKAGDLLQIGAYHLIQAVVSLFSALIG